MKNKSIKSLPIKFVLILALLLIITTSFAYYLQVTGRKENIVNQAYVNCEVITGNDSITAKNTSNIPVYIRLKVVFNYQDSLGNVYFEEVDSSKIPSISYDDNWFKDDANNIYYYKNIVGVNESITSSLTIQSPNGLDKVTGEEDKYLVLSVVAEAIQADPINAVKEAWYVDVIDGKLQLKP